MYDVYGCVGMDWPRNQPVSMSSYNMRYYMNAVWILTVYV